MTTTATLEALSDRQLEQEVARLESRAELLQDAIWPAANQQRAAVLDRLANLRGEIERRRA